MKNFRTLLKMISRNNDMEMPEHGDKAKGYKVMGIIAMCCIMIPCCLVVGFIVYIMTAALMRGRWADRGIESCHTAYVCIWSYIQHNGHI